MKAVISPDVNGFGTKTGDQLDTGLGTPYALRVAFEYDDQVDSPTLSSLQIFFEDTSSPTLVFEPIAYAPDRTSEDRSDERFLFEYGEVGGVVLKLTEVSKESAIWQRLFARFARVLPRRLDDARRAVEALKGRLGVFSESKDLKSGEASQVTNIQGMETERRAIELELQRLNNFLEHFAKYDFRAAITDLSTAPIDRVLLECRNFLPVRAIGTRPEGSMPGSGSRWRTRGFSGVDEQYAEWALMIATRGALEVCRSFQDMLRNLVYLGPLRQSPQREYVFVGSVGEYVGRFGELAPHILFKREGTLDTVNKRLAAAGLGYQIKIVSGGRATGLGNVFALRFVDQSTGIDVSDVDVGLGLSQVLPVVVQSVLSHGKLICIEQPEAQVHPRLQADLGSLFAECIKPPFENRFMIETHSEHILLRLQRHIRDGSLRAEDVSVIYVQPNAQGTKCLPLRLDSKGDFVDEWPDGFFEEGFRELFA